MDMAMLQAMLNESTVVDLQKKMQKEKRAAAKAEKKKARKNVRQAMDQVSERIDAELAASKSGNGTNDLRRRCGWRTRGRPWRAWASTGAITALPR